MTKRESRNSSRYSRGYSDAYDDDDMGDFIVDDDGPNNRAVSKVIQRMYGNRHTYYSDEDDDD